MENVSIDHNTETVTVDGTAEITTLIQVLSKL